MKVKALKNFKDLKGKAIRKKGDIFEVTKKRYEEINSTSSGTLVEKIENKKTQKEMRKNG